MAIAAIWFLVFLPSFVKGESSRQTNFEKIQATQNTPIRKLSEPAKQALRARRVRTVSATIAAVSLVISGLAVLELLATASGLPAAITAAASTFFFSFLTARSHRKYISLLSGSIRRVVPVTPPIKRSNLNAGQPLEKNWQPEELPKQSYLQTGAIEIVELAEVVSIQNEKAPEELANIDEILRRRRHVG